MFVFSRRDLPGVRRMPHQESGPHPLCMHLASSLDQLGGPEYRGTASPVLHFQGTKHARKRRLPSFGDGISGRR